jgi:copper transport protein
MKRLIHALILVAALALGTSIPARAHAVLVRSVPEAGAGLLEAPNEIVLEFTEALDLVASRVELFDSDGHIVIPGPGVIDPNDGRILRLEIDTLPDGVYSAVWRVRSAVDGHTTNGSLGFSIGETSSPASLLPPPGTPDPATRLPSTAETITRWLGYLSAVLAVGSLSFGFLVWRPAYRRETAHSEESDETVRRLIRRLSLSSLVILALATFGFGVVQAARALETSVWGTLTSSFSQIFAGRIGLWLGLRLVFTGILALFVLRLPLPGSGSSRFWGMILLFGGLLLLTFSLQGHGAARGSVIAVVVIWLHLAATTVWLGGLPMLFLALRRGGLPAAALVPRFSQAALFSVGTLVATGIYNIITYVGLPEALTGTTYGRALLIKTGVFGLLLGLGALNLLVLSPRLREQRKEAPGMLGRTVRIEMALGILLLLAVGVLSGVAPAFEALRESQAQGFIETARVDGVDMLVRVMPAEGGDNEIGVEFTDNRPGATEVPPEVLLRLSAIEMDMGTQQIEAASEDGLRYTARGSFFSMAGPWELEVIIRRPGFNDVRQTFEVDIQDSAS